MLLRRFRVEMEQKYTQPLFEKRLGVYPRLYSIISGFAKKSNIGIATNLDIKRAVEEIDQWDSSYAIFASDDLIGKLSEMRYEFHQLSKLSDTDLKSIEMRKKIFDIIRSVEISLQQEIGIFATKGFHNPKWFENDTQ
ncbi:MAG: hypothetical protein D3917_01125 [Candidatus Electrothrix sp. AX5]|nr:hypothetical protein [Candidatus Electrothrix sp. AX5]